MPLFIIIVILFIFLIYKIIFARQNGRREIHMGHSTSSKEQYACMC